MSEAQGQADEKRVKIERLVRSVVQHLAEDGDPDEAMRTMNEEIDALLSDEERATVARAAKAKQWERRAYETFQAISELMNEEPPLVSLSNPKETHDEYLALVEHVLVLWMSACDLFERGYYAIATFVSIACIEEVGKAGIAKMQAGAFLAVGWRPPNARGRPQLRSHTRKHFLAAGQGAFVNARLDRIVGLEHVAKFLDDVETGAIERRRQASLYADRTQAGLQLPGETIQRDEALRYVALAGELMAEVLGWEPALWQRLLGKVKEFEERYNLI
jgi:AbiV family abortive infection protein